MQGNGWGGGGGGAFGSSGRLTPLPAVLPEATWDSLRDLRALAGSLVRSQAPVGWESHYVCPTACRVRCWLMGSPRALPRGVGRKEHWTLSPGPHW